MTEQDYQALIAMGVIVWRFIATIREPILSKIRKRLTDAFPEYGEMTFSYIVWVIAFVLGYGGAVAAGDNGDLLGKLGWWEGHYIQFGWALTAAIIASGSAGLRLAEKWVHVRTEVKKPQ